MHILITGANGYLGQQLCKYFAEKKYAVTAAGRGQRRIPKDIFVKWISTDFSSVDAVYKLIVGTHPDVIIHTAAMSKPDECLQEQNKAYAHNVIATRQLAQAYQQINLKVKRFIYLSSDFIFGNGGPHKENDEPNPLNYYGETKRIAEFEVEVLAEQASIVRPVFIYGDTWAGIRPGFIQWVANSLKNEQPIRVVNDQLRTPTFAPDICNGIEAIIQQKKNGVWHLAGKDMVSPYDMACKVASMLNLSTEFITAAPSDSFHNTVKRPTTGGLNIDKAIEELHYNPVSLEEGLRRSFRL